MPMSISDLPAVNATLNGLSAILLAAGYLAIRQGKDAIHKKFMVSALISSALFLTCYVIYHANIGSKPFPGSGTVRLVYFVILVTHVVLAAAIVPLVIMTVLRAWRGDFARHVRLARWTLPLWFYVSVTGVVIYWMLYRLY